MEIALIIGIAVIAVGLFIIYQRIGASAPKTDDNSTLKLLNDTFSARMKEMTQQFQEQTRQVNLRLKDNFDHVDKSEKYIGDRLDGAAKVISGVNERLGKMEEANKRIYDIGKDIASLQDILRAPKLRGSMGEFSLEDILAQYFPQNK